MFAPIVYGVSAALVIFGGPVIDVAALIAVAATATATANSRTRTRV